MKPGMVQNSCRLKIAKIQTFMSRCVYLYIKDVNTIQHYKYTVQHDGFSGFTNALLFLICREEGLRQIGMDSDLCLAPRTDFVRGRAYFAQEHADFVQDYAGFR